VDTLHEGGGIITEERALAFLRGRLGVAWCW
jgi:hypothetical protein